MPAAACFEISRISGATGGLTSRGAVFKDCGLPDLKTTDHVSVRAGSYGRVGLRIGAATRLCRSRRCVWTGSSSSSQRSFVSSQQSNGAPLTTTAVFPTMARTHRSLASTRKKCASLQHKLSLAGSAKRA